MTWNVIQMTNPQYEEWYAMEKLICLLNIEHMLLLKLDVNPLQCKASRCWYAWDNTEIFLKENILGFFVRRKKPIQIWCWKSNFRWYKTSQNFVVNMQYSENFNCKLTSTQKHLNIFKWSLIKDIKNVTLPYNVTSL